MKPVYIGTSGYSYSHWSKVFYPRELPQSKWLEYYAENFNTVELNVTFYRLPQESAFSTWYKKTPKDFTFAVKGSRFITHVKKLNNIEDSLVLFMKRAKILKEKLGVILWQLPPNLKINTERLEDFLKNLKKYKHINAFEFRNESWFDEKIYSLLKKYNSVLVIADSPRYPLEEILTADFVYVRFHGGKVLYGSEYSKKELKKSKKT